MWPSGHRGDDSWTSFAQRRVITESLRFGLDLTQAGACFRGAAGPRSYPSPPMSGSPPLPPKNSREVAERSQGTYQATTQDVYSSLIAEREDRAQATPAGGSQPFLSDTAERATYPLPRLEGPEARPPLYSHPLNQGTAQPAVYLPAPGTGTATNQPGPLPSPQTYPPAAHRSMLDSIHDTPPKQQRKTKGHVASACVPCKKAHLRCISTNKEGACVDVQHKKRGRPRLRDDNPEKYEGARFGSAADAMRRPLSLAYGPGAPLGMVHDDPLRRSQSYRVLKSQPAESNAPRFPERGLASDANVYPAPLTIATARAPEEPVAYLTVGLEFSRASPSFLAAISRSSIAGLEFTNVLAVEDRPRASRLQQQAQEEQTKKDPAYLPPIFNDRSEAVMQSLGFSPEEVSRYPLYWQDTFTFLGDDGQARSVPVRAGLATRDSIYFVVLLLNRTTPSSYPTPSPSLRDLGGSFEPGLQPYSQRTPLSATFDSRQSRLGDAGHDLRQTGSLHMLPVRSPSLSSAYGVSPSRPDYPITPRTYQTPRTEVYPLNRSSQLGEYQLLPLPRIRSPPLGTSQQVEQPQPQQPPPSLPPPPPPPPPPYQAREERSRIGIGGLLEQPETTKSVER
ncbi:hypothetical protein C7999DRAFT_37591 [Corynascus novoguineensis]|uniref:Zn(2)-C6 fungal-type domain-containing protein n=1 Tax=Corynascus novoguineensis TaxID=1126955 RepID=A0AAN7D0L8_9PEZI|nr:hypothetical protein C7999DRAFT_37591 [Corynascus novoguineensis]